MGGMKRMRSEGILWIVLVIGLAACQSALPQISIEGAKAELSPAIVGEAMVSLKIVNLGGEDVIRGVRTSIPGATASFHVMQGQRMVTMDKLAVPARNVLNFMVGGSHIMIEHLPRDMKEGSPLTLTLTFEKSGEKQVPCTLQKAAPMPMSHGTRDI